MRLRIQFKPHALKRGYKSLHRDVFDLVGLTITDDKALIVEYHNSRTGKNETKVWDAKLVQRIEFLPMRTSRPGLGRRVPMEVQG